MLIKSQATLRLSDEIALNRGFRGESEATFLALARTWQRLEALGRSFFAAHGLTDAQFNTLMILWDYRQAPLRQNELAGKLLVGRASAGGVIARMEHAGWVTRDVDPEDTRARIVRLTRAGEAKFHAVREPWYRLQRAVFREEDGPRAAAFVNYLDVIRRRLDERESRGG